MSRLSARRRIQQRCLIAAAACAVGLAVVAGAGVIGAPVGTERADVARADVSLLRITAPAALSDPNRVPVSHRVAQPLRLTDRSVGAHDLSLRVHQVLAGLGYHAAGNDSLHDLLVRTLAGRQSDAYISAAIVAGHRDGVFSLPDALILSGGRPDTDRLLQAFLETAGG